MANFYASYPITGSGGGSGLISINSDTTSAQLLTVGTSGTNFAIVDAGSGSHVFNLPTASASNRGALSSTDWSTFNSKQAALTLGDLTESGSANLTVTGGTGSVVGSGVLLTLTGATLLETTSSVLTITGGTNAVLGTGVSIQVKQSNTTTSGYLSSTDWNTFNGKQASGNYITALTGDVTASGPGSSAATLATVNANVGSFTNSSITVNAKGLITAASSASTTGSGATVLATSPTLVTPALGTPTALVGTNITGTASGLTAGTVTTNANLTGDVTSSGNATTLATVNSNVGSFTNASLTVNAKGLITAASNGTSGTPTVTSVSASTSMVNNTIYLVNTSAARNMTFPAPTANAYILVKDSTGAAQTNNITVLPNAAETIDGASSYVITFNRGWAAFTSDGTNWFVTDASATITNWATYTLTIGAVTTPPTPGTNTSLATWRRNGDSIEIMYNFNQANAGSAGSGMYLFPLPSGPTIDTTKVTANTGAIAQGASIVGFGQLTTTATPNSNFAVLFSVAVYNTTNFSLITYNGSQQMNAIGSGNFSLAANTPAISYFAKVPITGWKNT